MTASRDELIAGYLNAVLALVPIPAGQKGPTERGWNRPENCITTLAQAVRLNGSGSIGLAHAYSDPPTCAIDVDDMTKARPWLAERSVDIDALLAAPDAVRIDSGRPGRAKLLYRLDAPLPQKKVKIDGADVIDFRCASQDGLTVQDVLPPSVHPDTGQPYRLHGDISKIPRIPPELLRIWRGLIDAQPAKTAVVTTDCGLPERFVELLAGDEALRKRWEGNTEGLDDPSRNGLDMSLTALAVARGLNDAEITAIHRAYPYGKVVQDGRGADYIRPMIDKARCNRILSRTEPLTNARRMLAERFTAADGVGLLRYWHGDFYLRCDGAYRMLDEQDMSARIWSYLGGARHFVKKGKTEPFKPNRARVGDTLGALKAIAHLDSHTPNPCWLDGAGSDAPQDLLVVANGMLHMPSRTLRPHDPRLFTTTALPFAYAPNADPPVEWLAFLKSLWGDDKETIETLQEIFGYCLTTDCSQQKIPLVVGPKRSGKGTIARVLRGVVGEANCAGPTLASLATNFGLQPLIGKRLAIISDARLGNRTDKHALTERLCSISGEDVLTIDRKYNAPWTGRLGVRLIMFTNELPKIIDDSNALSSRFIVLRMTNSFFGKEDLGLADRLLKELPAILSWSLDGLARLKARGAFRQPVSAMELVQELEDLSSPIGAFLRDKCVVRPGAYVECHQLYGAWVNYCACEGWHSAGTSASFGAALRAALPQLERKYVGPKSNRHWVYSGVALAAGTATVTDLAAVRAKNKALLL